MEEPFISSALRRNLRHENLIKQYFWKETTTALLFVFLFRSWGIFITLSAMNLGRRSYAADFSQDSSCIDTGTYVQKYFQCVSIIQLQYRAIWKRIFKVRSVSVKVSCTNGSSQIYKLLPTQRFVMRTLSSLDQ